MKKLIPYLSTLSLLVLLGTPVLAALPTGTINPPLENEGITKWFQKGEVVLKWIYTFLLAVAVFLIIFTAFDYLTSGGNPEKVKAATKKLTYAVIAIIVAILAFSFLKILEGIL